MFLFEKFLKQFEIKKTFEKFNQFINYISYKYSIDNDKLNKDVEEFLQEERDKLFVTTLEDDFKTFAIIMKISLWKNSIKITTFKQAHGVLK